MRARPTAVLTRITVLKPHTHPRRKMPTLEPMEPRVLLSATQPIPELLDAYPLGDPTLLVGGQLSQVPAATRALNEAGTSDAACPKATVGASAETEADAAAARALSASAIDSLDTNLEGYWKFDGDGTDASGAGKDLTLVGSPGFADGLSGQALDLHGNNSQYAVLSGESSAFDLYGDDFTIQVWVNYYSTDGGQLLIEKYSGNNGPGWSFTTIPAGNYGFGAGGPNWELMAAHVNVSVGEWHQLVARRSGREVTTFFDADCIARSETDFVFTSSPNPLLIGRRNPQGVVFPLDGRLDDIAIWSRALTDDEIETLYEEGTGTVKVRMFDPHQEYGVGVSPESVALGDFNGDGAADLATADRSQDIVSVLLNNRDGTFQPSQAFATGPGPYDVAVGDFNGDRLVDIATADYYSSYAVSVLLGNGDGTFQPRHGFGLAQGARSLAVGDFDGDGAVDLATADEPFDTVSVLLGNGDGTFRAPQAYAVGYCPRSVAVGDFNGDGTPDIATADYYSYAVSVLLGNGDGTFQPSQAYSVEYYPTSVAVGDFDGDGAADLATANDWVDSVSVLLGNGDGTFQPRRDYTVGSLMYDLAVGDYDGDGAPDIATADSHSNSTSVLLGNGDGTFQGPRAYAVGMSPHGVAAGDLDGDGVPDLVTANAGGFWAVSVLLNRSGPPRPDAEIIAPRMAGAIVVGDTLRFAGRGSAPAAVQPLLCSWDFGDGRVSILQNPGLLSFPTAGQRLVTFDVIDNRGRHDPTPDTRTIDVVPDPGPLPDLRVAAFDLPADLAAGQPRQLGYEVVNAGDAPLVGGSWGDAIYLSTDPYLGADDALLATAPISGNLAVGESYSASIEVIVPALSQGASYLILSVDDQWQVLEPHQLNNESAAATDVVIPRLQDGVEAQTRFPATGARQYYRVDVPMGGNLSLRLNGADAAGIHELYARRGSLPTRGSYDYNQAGPPGADAEILIPSVAPGTWYVLAYGAYVPGSGQYSIVADLSGTELLSVTPDHHGNAADAVLTIAGAGFLAGAQVALVAPDNTAHPAAAVSVDSYTQITATFAAGTVPASQDPYSVRVTLGGDSDQLDNAFRMTGGGQARLETNLVVPTTVRPRGLATLYVEYANTGDAAMPSPLLVLSSGDPDGNEDPVMTLDESLVVGGVWTSADPEGFSNSVQFLAGGVVPGVLQPGETGQVPVYFVGFTGPNDGRVEFSLGVLTTDSTSPVDWSGLKDEMRPSYIRADAWDAIWANFTSQVGTTWGDYVAMLDENASYLGRLGERELDIGQLLAFEFRQADALSPIPYLASATDALVQAPGLPIAFQRSFADPISRRFESGPLGRGWTFNWQLSLAEAADGTVTITDMGGTRRIFQPDSRPGRPYLAQPGDQGALTKLPGGNLTLREAVGSLTAFRSDGKLDYVEDTNGNRITCGYTGALLTSLTHSSGQSLQIAYSAAGRITDVTDSDGRQSLYTYDAANEHLLSVQGYDGRVTSYSYSVGQGAAQEHALTEIAFPGGAHQYFAYDPQGRLASISRDGDAERINFAYDSTGKVSATDADPLPGATSFFFDNSGRILKTEDALGNAVHMTFDGLGNLTRVTDPAGRATGYVYDTRGNLIRSTDALGNATRFTYTSSLNRLASVTDANGNRTSYAYDTDGNLVSITYADGSRESWAYDPLGEPSSWTNRRANVIAYIYDADGRLTRKTYADTSYVSYEYDARGNLIRTVDPNGTTVYTYDANDYLTRITYPDIGTTSPYLEFTYDAAGRRASSLDQTGHRLDYHYDAVGRLESLTDETSTEIVHYTYDAAGLLSRKDLGNGVYTTYDYDAAGQLLHLVNYQPDGTVLSRFDYTYDSRGRRISMDTVCGLWTYGYDDLGQLTHAVLVSTDAQVPNQDLTYVYDALGNRIRTIENGVTTDYTSNNMNQYTRTVSSADGATTYTFDADGNLIREVSTGGTTTYTYDDGNRLITVNDGTSLWEYTYDALGNRVATTENGTTARYVIDPIGLGNVVGRYDDAGSLIAHYDHGFGLVSQIDPIGTPGYYTFDAIGSTSELTDAAGVVVNGYAYTPFGNILRTTEGVANPFEFVGAYGVTFEGYGMSFMRARLFSHDLGRFSSVDPMGVAAGDQNPYRYVLNNPTSSIDPSGLWWWDTHGNWGGRDRVNGRSGQDNDQPFPIEGEDGWRGWTDDEDRAYYHHDVALHNAVHIADDQRRQEARRAADRALAAELRALGNQNPVLRYLEDVFEGEATWGPYIGRSPNDDPGNYVPETAPHPPSQSQSAGSSGVAGSSDPNEKTGPAGFGDADFISADNLLAYRVDFENESSATAPAQQVVTTDHLDGDLDWSTFELAEIGFGDQLLAIPDNSQHFETTVPMSYNGVEFEVQVEAGIRFDTGEVYAIFQSIDPISGLPPNVLLGFLPPEDGTGRGMGYLSYVVKPKAGLPTGTEIRNVALIQFDGGEIIGTNQVDPHDPSEGTDPAKECLNTIDAGVPVSQVLALPATVPATSFLVEWTGQDDPGDSGIAGYDVYSSADGGPYVLWLDDTQETSAAYVGLPGHSYAFYSVATDNVGHGEAIPPAADAFTHVNARPTAGAGDDRQAIDTDGDGYADFVLDASGSFDVEGLASYRWSVAGRVLAEGPDAEVQVVLPIGRHWITLTVVDTDGAMAFDEAVVDVTPPPGVGGPVTLANPVQTAVHERGHDFRVFWTGDQDADVALWTLGPDGWQCLAEGIPAGQASWDWDVSGVGPGWRALAAVAGSGATATHSLSAGWLQVADAEVTLYDGSLSGQQTLPAAQGWLYATDPLFGAAATQAPTAGGVTLDTTGAESDSAGYFSKDPILGLVEHPAMPALDRAAGYAVEFRLRVEAESHSSADRAGFSLIVLSSDGLGIELGFWSDEVWAQSGPDFHHAEGAVLDTTAALVDYDLRVLGDTYCLWADGTEVLSGALRDYSSHPHPVYTQTSFLFLGDDTSSAAARAELAEVSVGLW